MGGRETPPSIRVLMPEAPPPPRHPTFPANLLSTSVFWGGAFNPTKAPLGFQRIREGPQGALLPVTASP